MSIFMLLTFEVETGIASACVLSCGILIMLVVVIHSLVKASHTAKKFRTDHIGALYQNDHGSSGIPRSRPCELKIGVDKPRMQRTQSYLQHNMAFAPCGNPNPIDQHLQYSSTEASNEQTSHKDGYSSGGSSSRMHRTLSSDSALLQAQVKPWNGVNNEMRSVLARKSGISAKDSTLV